MSVAPSQLTFNDTSYQLIHLCSGRQGRGGADGSPTSVLWASLNHAWASSVQPSLSAGQVASLARRRHSSARATYEIPCGDISSALQRECQKLCGKESFHYQYPPESLADSLPIRGGPRCVGAFGAVRQECPMRSVSFKLWQVGDVAGELIQQAIARML